MRWIAFLPLLLLGLALQQVALAYNGGPCDTKIVQFDVDGSYSVTCIRNGCAAICTTGGIPKGSQTYTTCICPGTPVKCNMGYYVDPELGLITGCVELFSCPTGECNTHNHHYDGPGRWEMWCTCD